jgi:hypothetical protein
VSDFRPSVTVRGGVWTVSLGAAEGGRQVDFEGIVDQTDFGDVVGIEILDLNRQVEAVAPHSPRRGYPRWSYDDEIDAFYVHVADGPGQVQRVTSGSALVDAAGTLTTLEVTVSR